jgi:hypothetical protein
MVMDSMRVNLTLGDILRADVPRLHRALTSDPYRRSPILRWSYRFFHWLEHHGRYRNKVAYCPPVPMLWCLLPGDGRPATILHKTYLRELWRERGIGGRTWLIASIVLLWLPINLVLILWSTSINGMAVARRTGKGVMCQASEQLRLSARHAILSPWYYTFELHDDVKRQHAAAYLHRFETKGGLYRLLKASFADGTLSPLQDKVLFAKRCAEYGVRTLPSIAVADKGRLVFSESGHAVIPRTDIFIKPALGRGGEGANRWDYIGDDSYRSSGGNVLTEAQLAEHFSELSRQQAHLVQPRASNHSSIADLSNGALSTVRIVTCKNESGGIEATDVVQDGRGIQHSCRQFPGWRHRIQC